MRLLYQFPTWLQRLYTGVTWRKSPSSKVVYLTFDDGPIPEVTPQLLDILRDKNVHATFFMVGENAARYPDLLARVRREGHAVGNHTFNHLKGTRTDTLSYIANVVRADEVLHTMLFRPPYGRMTCAQKKTLLEQGYRIYLWDVLTHDYNPRYSAEQLLQIVQRYTRNGSIINFHDSLKSGDRMLAAIPQVIDYLLAEGYAFAVL
ncbi:MAG: polysaccharide deacetylase family protein [Paludibacteraceae bacterium]|nr:polysaccharide deacetylase family protein [Paludibacteraceae bacterium]